MREHIERVARAAGEAAPIVASTSATTATGNLVSLGPEAQTLVPYISALEASLAEYEKLHETLRGRMEMLSASIDADSGDLHQRVQTMGDAFGSLFSSYKRLGETYERSQSIAARSGKLIEGLHKLRRRSLDAKELFQIFLDLANGKGTARLDAILASSTADTRRLGAKIVRRLKLLAKAEIPGTESASQQIDQLVETYEERLLQEFHQAFEENDMSRMRSTASVLVEYNGGQSCVQSFVSQHAFFLEAVRPEDIISALHPSKPPSSLDFSTPPKPDPLLVTLYEQIRKTAEADWKYLEAVFEEPVVVMNYLMQRIFHEIVQIHLDELLRQARAHSSMAYLRALFASHAATKELIARMKASYERHVREVGARQHQLSSHIDEVLHSVDTQLSALTSDLFAQHLEPKDFLPLERKVFTELLAMATSPLHAYIAAKKAASRGMISSVFGRQGGSSPLNAGLSPNIDIASRAQLFLFSDGKPLLSMSDGDDGIPSEDVVKHCLVLHAELATRWYALLPDEERGAALEQSFRLLLQFLFERYVEASLDCAIEASDAGTKGFDARSCVIVGAACRILSLVLLYCRTHFLPIIVTASPTAYRSMVQAKTEAAARITEKIDRLLRKECDGALYFIEHSLLSRQKKTDYKPKADDLEALVGPSQVCHRSSAERVGVRGDVRLCRAARQDGHRQARHAQCSHPPRRDRIGPPCAAARAPQGLPRQRHGRNGPAKVRPALHAPLPRSDLRRYRKLLDAMDPAADLLRDRFEMLWELGHLFVVRPENLRSILLEGHLGRIDAKLIYPFISQRADFASANIQQLFPDMEKSFTRLFM